MKTVAVIIPALNEAENIQSNLAVVREHLAGIKDISFTLIVVDDGSTDNTAELVCQMREQIAPATEACIHLLSLNRHFGKESAIAAGLQAAIEFDAAIVMDSDLQHPPALIAEMVTRWSAGAQVVEAVKSSRGNETRTRGLLVRTYYALFNYLTRLSISDHTDFKLLDKSVVAAYVALPEHGRFFRGLVNWMNFPSEQILFDVPESTRKRSAWGNGALFRYAIDSITSFTAFPLQIVTLLGGLTFLLSLVIGVMALSDKISGTAVDGFTTVILLILLIGSVLMFSVGLIGIYVGRIYDEVKRRPGYLIDQRKSTLRDVQE
ncbi:MAG: glycosyltransferase family 2 protein [Pseudohongiella sp.]|nr:glycosyltransferase family 2 protein [Pseudohongiella sp.]